LHRKTNERQKEPSTVNFTLPGRQSESAVSREQEHQWRELLQKQLADHWLKLKYPEEIKPKDVILEKIRGSEGKVA
jgi:hypothetical protein